MATKAKFLQLQALDINDKFNAEWCYIDIDSIQALIPGFKSRGTYILSSSGLQTHVLESPREIMAMLEELYHGS